MKIIHFVIAALLFPTLLPAVDDTRRKSDALVLKGVEMYQKNDYKSASDLLGKAAAMDPTNDAAQYYLGYLDIVADNAAGALTHFSNAYGLDSTNYWYNLRLANLYVAIGKPEQAGAMFEKLLISKPYDLSVMSSLTDVYIQLGKLNQADSLLSRIERINGPSQYSTLTRLDLLRFSGRYNEFFKGLASLFSEAEVPSKAKVDMMEKMLKSADPRFNYLHLDDYDNLLQTCLAVHPSDTAVLHLAVGFYYSVGNVDKSLELCRTAAPDNVKMKEFELYINIEKKDFVAALDCCDKLLELSGDDRAKLVDLYTVKGDCNSELGHKEAAQREYEKALKMDPDNLVTLNNYAYYMACQGKNLSKCAKMARKVVEAKPENVTFLDTYGWILFKQKKYTEAKTVFKKAMLYGGKDQPSILEHYADILEALGENALADGYRRQAQLKRKNAAKK